MKDYRLIFDCNCKEFADWYENEVLNVEFCDLTHWYCGFDGAGDDTPDLCIIYRGIYYSNRINVEFDLKQSGYSIDDIERIYIKLVESQPWKDKGWIFDNIRLETINLQNTNQ